MENNLNGCNLTQNELNGNKKWPRWKTSSTENDLNGNRLQQKSTWMEKDLNGKQPQQKTTSTENNLNGIQPQRKTTSTNVTCHVIYIIYHVSCGMSGSWPCIANLESPQFGGFYFYNNKLFKYSTTFHPDSDALIGTIEETQLTSQTMKFITKLENTRLSYYYVKCSGQC